LAGQSITELAQQHHVSRKFVYQQAGRAQQALDPAFTPPPPGPEPVLFTLPITRSWLQQFVLALTLIGHSPLRGIQEILQDLFDFHLSLGTIHNVVHAAVAPARACNARPDLSGIRLGAHDELFQHTQPVLVGADIASTYCYLLRQESHRDSATWAIHLWDLQHQGFDPQAVIADGGTGLRAGQRLALPGVPCWADLFHVEREFSQLVRFLDNRAYGVLATAARLERSNPARGRTGCAAAAAQRREAVRQESDRSVALADDVALLERWLREDILAVAGPPLEERRALFDFVVAQLRQREPQCPHRLGPVRSLLEKQRDDLLAFVEPLDQDLTNLAHYYQLPPATVRELLAVQALPGESAERWQREAALRPRLGPRWREVNAVVTELGREVVRASSVIENLNSRLRGYFFLRRHLGTDYLDLLRFFLNHRRFVRSEHAARVGKSPAELLTQQAHPHWLELLGYQRFRQAS
jgi:hypothetical protein